MVGQRPERFSLPDSHRKKWALAMTISAAGFGLGSGLFTFLHKGPSEDLGVIAVILVIGITLGGWAFLYVSKMFWVELSPQGIRVSKELDGKNEVPWSQLRVAIAGMEEKFIPPYIFVAISRQGDSIKIPMAIATQPRFRELVITYAGAGNPLTQCLLKNV